ncbi:membrane-spanning 4-domains subfamily A member 14 [Nycticebus coucang]|uniref:membrane-spanning 4-domains subfamily A member 14 n=1 Tax=Nycticebus coucang TaxID=9470 RepID=UPI00234D9B87|nr:membrane-spanning 4-domains subfamily A member 14 [Nycticebus coucang]
MESPSEDKRETHVITIQPKDTILTALPYRPHSSLLEFLKGEPKVLGALQILLGLFILGLGIIFVFSYIVFSQNFSLFFLAGYPFWGPFIFILTGYLTGIDDKPKKILEQGIMAMNIISSFVAIAGITLTFISYKYQYKYCQNPSLEDICVLWRTFFIGILSILLIISIAELSISVTIASFRSKCWTHTDEVVFFLPTDVVPGNEPHGLGEDAPLQFELQEESCSDDTTTTRIQTVFFGGYAFFKLRVTRSPLASQLRLQPGRHSYQPPSAPVPKKQQKSFPSLFQSTEGNPLSPPTLEKQHSKNITHTQKDSIFELKDKDLESAIVQPPKIQTQLVQDKDLPLQLLPSYSVLKLQKLSPEDLPPQGLPGQAWSSQNLPAKAMTSKTPAPHVMQSYDLTNKDLPFQDILSQDTPSGSQNIPSQDFSSQDTLSHTLSKAILSEASMPHMVQPSNTKYLLQKTPDIQPQNQQLLQKSYKDIQSEVKEETQKWNSEEEFPRKKSSRRHSLDYLIKVWKSSKKNSLDKSSKSCQSSKRNFLYKPSKSWQSSKKNSLDKPSKSWQSPKRNSLDKPIQHHHTPQQLPDQQAEVQQAKGERSPKGIFKDGQDMDQRAEKEQGPEEQTHDQEADDQQSPKEKSSKGQSPCAPIKGQQSQAEKAPNQLCQNWGSQTQKYRGWRSTNKQSSDHSIQDLQFFSPLQSQESGTQSWRSRDQIGCQCEMQHSLNWGSQACQAQSPSDKKALRQKTVDQETQTQHTTAQYNLGWHLQNTKSTGQFSKELQSEDTKPDILSSSGQSSVQDTSLGYFSNIESEQDMQQITSACSNSYREDPNVTSDSSFAKYQQSEDSD